MAIERIPILTFVKEIEAAWKRGDGYIMGSFGENPRTGYHDLAKTTVKSSWKENGWFFTQYSGKQREQALKWRKNCTRVWDCQGLAEGVYMILKGKDVNTRAVNNYATWCPNHKGKGMIPVKFRVPGACVYWGDTAGSIHHIGYLYKPVVDGKPEGDWYIIEARGVMYGVVRTKLYERKPNFWGWMEKYYDYEVTSPIAVPNNEAIVPVLKNGSTGDSVKTLQTQLIELGYDCGKWGADGDYGDATELAVKEFQKEHSLTVDGIVGEKTHAALDAAMAAIGKAVEDPATVKIVGGACYVRNLPNTSGEKIGAVKEGTMLPFGGAIDDETKWVAVKYNDRDGWVSGKYGKLVK